MENKEWKISEVEIQSGKIAIVTGSNTGLGFETAKALAKKGIEVWMACRDEEKAKDAIIAIKKETASANLTFLQLDLGDLSSVRAAATTFLRKQQKLDILVNNAGAMMPPYQKTKDGFELQFGVNYLGHFLLTALLFDAIKATKEARIIQLSSLAHKWGDIYFDDPNFEKTTYDKRKSYGQSKLACLIFAYELQRRCDAKGFPIKSMAAHPGISDTELYRYLPGWMKFIGPVFNTIAAQSPRAGALPALRAALDTGLQGGEFIGPNGWGEMKGKPVQVDSSASSKRKPTADKLWTLSEKMVGAEFKI